MKNNFYKCGKQRERMLTAGLSFADFMHPKSINGFFQLIKKAVDLLYDIGKHLLETYSCFEELQSH